MTPLMHEQESGWSNLGVLLTPTLIVTGCRFRAEVLAVGNSRDPWVSVERLLGYRPSVEQLASAAAAKPSANQ